MTYVLGVCSGMSAVVATFSWLSGSYLGQPDGKRNAIFCAISAVVCGLLAAI